MCHTCGVNTNLLLKSDKIWALITPSLCLIYPIRWTGNQLLQLQKSEAKQKLMCNLAYFRAALGSLQAAHFVFSRPFFVFALQASTVPHLCLRRLLPSVTFLALLPRFIESLHRSQALLSVLQPRTQTNNLQTSDVQTHTMEQITWYDCACIWKTAIMVQFSHGKHNYANIFKQDLIAEVVGLHFLQSFTANIHFCFDMKSLGKNYAINKKE